MPMQPTRRSVLGAALAVAGTGALAACSGGGSGHGGSHSPGGGAQDSATYVSPDGKETTLVFSDWPEMNGTAKLRKNQRNPPGASGALRKEDGSEWDMSCHWKDG